MTQSTNKFEQLLELLINEENDKAQALFHEIVVEKSRDIYEGLAETETKEDSKEEVKETEKAEVTAEAVKEVIWPLGLVNVREKRIRKMSEQFAKWDQNDATELYGIGKYGSDSYEIFFKQNYSVQPTDKELLRYLREEIKVAV